MNIFKADHIKKSIIFICTSKHILPHPPSSYQLCSRQDPLHPPPPPGGLHPCKADDGKATTWNIMDMMMIDETKNVIFKIAKLAESEKNLVLLSALV